MKMLKHFIPLVAGMSMMDIPKIKMSQPGKSQRRNRTGIVIFSGGTFRGNVRQDLINKQK